MNDDHTPGLPSAHCLLPSAPPLPPGWTWLAWPNSVGCSEVCACHEASGRCTTRGEVEAVAAMAGRMEQAITRGQAMTIIHDDILHWAATYDGPPFHALLADPPYHLTDPRDPRRGFPHRDDAGWSAPGRKGFLGKDWDGGDLSFRPETWAALAEHLYPGAFGMVFASTRGYHRMACAIEDAGLIIHPMLVWINGSGFPKATRIDSQVDKAAGTEGTWEQVEHPLRAGPRVSKSDAIISQGDHRTADNPTGERHLYRAATPLAAAWASHRYGLQALKPALEPICVFQKPYEGRPVDCITATGAGALNIDAGRVATAEDTARNRAPVRGAVGFGRGVDAMGGDGSPLGRWPTNLVLSHDPRCNGECVEGCAVKALGEQSGIVDSRPVRPENIGKSGCGDVRGMFGTRSTVRSGYYDKGTAARYFFNADWALDRFEADAPFYYAAKAGTAEREAGLDDLGTAVVKIGAEGLKVNSMTGRAVVDPPRRNTHPTIKPLSLCRHLASLLLPPDAYAPRRLLIPFAGAASEMIGAHLAGWEDVIGIELEAAHISIARARLDWWRTAARRLYTVDPAAILAMQEAASQPTLFDFEEDA